MRFIGACWRVGVLVLSFAVFSCGDDDDGAPGADGGGGSGASPGAGEIDACQLVRAADAEALFGQPAERDEDLLVTDPALLGQCQWTYEDEDENGGVGSQSLQVYVWEGPEYHSVPAGADELDVGEDGYLQLGERTGIDVGWVQDGRAISLGYFSIGTGMPEHASKVGAMRALAATVSSRL